MGFEAHFMIFKEVGSVVFKESGKVEVLSKVGETPRGVF